MKALTYHAAKDIRFESIPDAKITAPHAAIVKVKACGICGSDLHIYQGHGFSDDIGFCVGHEAVGEIVEIGPHVETLKIGDQVMISAAVGCGRCAACRAGDCVKCEFNATGCYGLSHALEGCQAEAVMVPHADQNAARIPEGLTLEQGLLLTDNLPTAYLGASNADIRPGGIVAVVGLGPIGLMAVEIAFALGAARVYAADLVPERRAMAERLGAIPLTPGDERAELKEFTKGRFADSVIEAVGADATLKLAIALAGKQATVSTIGVNQTKQFPFPMALAFNKGLTFRTSLCSVVKHWSELVPLVRGGRLKPEQFISHRMPLSEGAHAYELFNERRDGALKMVLTL
ncbi:MAG: alcohol dehydrogenase family protein [Hyphomonadaceae bacterium]